MKIAAIADIHVHTAEPEKYSEMIRNATDSADVLVLAGDLTNEGLVPEAELLRSILNELRIPVVAVMGNHEFDNGQEAKIIEILSSPYIHILNGTQTVINGVGFAGVKGFMGGFGNLMLPKFGESLLKAVVDLGMQEALALEKALALLETKTKIVLTHYSPIPQTVYGEPDEIYPFLGLGRLEVPINNFGVTLAFHGHAHNGTYEGKTSAGVPVYNVSLPVLRKLGMNTSVHEIEV